MGSISTVPDRLANRHIQANAARFGMIDVLTRLIIPIGKLCRPFLLQNLTVCTMTLASRRVSKVGTQVARDRAIALRRNAKLDMDSQFEGLRVCMSYNRGVMHVSESTVTLP